MDIHGEPGTSKAVGFRLLPEEYAEIYSSDDESLYDVRPIMFSLLYDRLLINVTFLQMPVYMSPNIPSHDSHIKAEILSSEWQKPFSIDADYCNMVRWRWICCLHPRTC